MQGYWVFADILYADTGTIIFHLNKNVESLIWWINILSCLLLSDTGWFLRDCPKDV